MKKIMFVAIMMLVVSVSNASFTYSLTTNKETYSTDESIFIDFSVTNETEEVLIWPRTWGTLGAKIINTATDEVVWSSPRPEVHSMIFLPNKLLPGKTFEIDWTIDTGLPHGLYDLEGTFFGLDYTEYSAITVIPEPSTLILLSIGIMTIRRRKRC
jgi:hypothetical protein